MRLQPEGLQLGVALGLVGELVVFEDAVQLAKVAEVEGDDGPRSEHGLALVELLDVGVGDGEGPEEPAQPLDVPALLQGLADGRHLVGGKGGGG